MSWVIRAISMIHAVNILARVSSELKDVFQRTSLFTCDFQIYVPDRFVSGIAQAFAEYANVDVRSATTNMLWAGELLVIQFTDGEDNGTPEKSTRIALSPHWAGPGTPRVHPGELLSAVLSVLEFLRPERRAQRQDDLDEKHNDEKRSPKGKAPPPSAMECEYAPCHPIPMEREPVPTVYTLAPPSSRRVCGANLPFGFFTGQGGGSLLAPLILRFLEPNEAPTQGTGPHVVFVRCGLKFFWVLHEALTSPTTHLFTMTSEQADLYSSIVAWAQSRLERLRD
jgi:hypothetical protein